MTVYFDEIRPIVCWVERGDSLWRHRLRWLLGDRWRRLRLPVDAPSGYWLVPSTGEQILWDGRSCRRGFGALRAQFVSEGLPIVCIGELHADS